MITRSVAISMRSVPCYSHSFAVCARARAPRPRSRQVASRNREAGARGRGAASSTGRANDNEAEAGNNTPGGRVTAAAFAAARPRKGTRPRPSSHFSPIKPRAPLVHSSLAHPPRGSQTACARLPVHNLPASPLPPSLRKASSGPDRPTARAHTQRERERPHGRSGFLWPGARHEHGAARQEGGAHGAAGAGDRALRQQLRLPGQPGHAEPVPELLLGVEVVVVVFAAVPYLLSLSFRAGRRGAAAEAGAPGRGAAAGASGRGRGPACGGLGQDFCQPVLQLPEARGADGVPVPLRRPVLRRAPVLGPPRLPLRLQGRRPGRHRPGEPGGARGQDR
jgi:hypothetical protein